MAVVTRASKGSLLTHSEMDTNFEEINLKANSTDMTTALALKANSTDVGVANSSLVKTALNASGSAPIYACRAWVNFNGTGTVAIRASGNVSSITDNDVGKYTINFTTAMEDTSYSVTSFVRRDNDDDFATQTLTANSSSPKTASSLAVVTRWINNGGAVGSADMPEIDIAIFR